MLRDHFYTVQETTPDDRSFRAVVAFNSSHAIFKGHFPGHPVVPGVCMIQMLRELMEAHTGAKLRISSGDNLKFLAVINPEEHKQVEVSVSFSETNGLHTVNATIQNGNVTFFKFKGAFKKV
jgi:3-hydroxyacyl-[acyl-carrier-protein] dehydratase